MFRSDGIPTNWPPAGRSIQISLGGQSTNKFLEAVPVGGRPDFRLGVTKGAYDGRDAGCRLDVVGDEDVEIIVRPQHSITVEPFNVRTFFGYVFMASRSSCSSPLGERTASGFNRVNMMKVAIAAPLLMPVSILRRFLESFDFNQLPRS